MSERGEINYSGRFKQLISFHGIKRHRNITPTDIDALIDYNGNAFIFFEGKHENKDLDFGQKKAIENLVNGLSESGRPSCCFVFKHNSNVNDIVIAKDCLVTEIYFQGKWKCDIKKRTVLQCIEDFEKYCVKIFITI